MPLPTTVVGAYPNPSITRDLPRWFPEPFEELRHNVADHAAYLRSVNQEELNKCLEKAEQEVIQEQIDLGIDVITDGELRRYNYIWHFCRQIKAFDFTKLTNKACRNGSWTADVPTIAKTVEIPEDVSWIADEWKEAQAKSSRPVKMTLPGPMTIINSTENQFYSDEKALSKDLAAVINTHILKLVEAGCKHIQLDEPLFARLPERALEYGMEHAALCIKNVDPAQVYTYIHLCRGYPAYLDQENFEKADQSSYFKFAYKLDMLGFHGVSIEDAECQNDLTLLDHFKTSKVILGSVAVARSRVESVEEIRSRLQEALKHVPAERLIVAPDCGLGFLPRDVLRKKLTNMVAAAKSLP